MIVVEKLAELAETFVHQIVDERVTVFVAVERFPAAALAVGATLRKVHNLLSPLKRRRAAQFAVRIEVKTNDDVGVISQNGSQIVFVSVAIHLDWVEFNVCEIYLIILKIKKWRSVRSAIDWSTRLNLQCGSEHIAVVGRYVEHETAVDALVVAIHKVGPVLRIHKLVQCRLQRLENLFVGALQLRCIHRNRTFQLLRRKRKRDKRQQSN